MYESNEVIPRIYHLLTNGHTASPQLVLNVLMRVMKSDDDTEFVRLMQKWLVRKDPIDDQKWPMTSARNGAQTPGRSMKSSKSL
jgi:hypothetical protein